MSLGRGSTEVPNAIFAAIPTMSAAELLCTMVLVRETYGCDRPQVRLTHRDFKRLTGIGGKGTIIRALQAVERRGFFRRTDQRSVWEACETDQPREPGAPRSI